MALAFLNRCIWRATSGGTGDFVVASAISGYKVPEDCANPAVVDGATYRYFAESDDKTQWEIGYGVYTTANDTLTRATVLDSSTGSKVNFSAAPKVHMGGPLAQEMHWDVLGDTTVSSPVPTIEHPVDFNKYGAIKFLVLNLQNASNVAADGMDFGWQLQQADGTIDWDYAGQYFVNANSAADQITGVIEIFAASSGGPLTFRGQFVSGSGNNAGFDFANNLQSSDLSNTTKIVYFFSDESSDFTTATATNSTGGRIVTYGLRLP